MNNEDKKFFSKPVTKVFVHAFNSKARIVIEQGGSRCFDGNTLVLTKRGEIPIKEIVIGDIVKSFNESNGLFEWKEVQANFKMANTKPTIRIRFKNGKEIICTDDHEFYFKGRWVAIKSILFDNWIIVNNRRKLFEIPLGDIESYEYVEGVEYVYDIFVTDNTNYFISAGKDILVHNSSKTWSIMQVLLVRCILEPGIVCTVVGQDGPNLKDGPISDFRRMLFADPHLKDYVKSENNTTRKVMFHNGSILEFNAYDDEQDAHSGSRDYSFFNEANGIPYGIYRQVAMRTRKQIFIDFNPTSEFWAHSEVYRPRQYDKYGEPLLNDDGTEKREINPDVDFKISNYRHNPHIEQSIIDDIESYKFKDPEYYKVYGLGQMGVIEGLVYKRVRVIPDEWWDRLLKENKTYHGLDYGFSDDPNAMTRIAKKVLSDKELDDLGIKKDHNGYRPKNIFFCHECFYSRGMGIDLLAKKIKQHNPDNFTWCDVNPLLTSELQMRGCNVRQTKKPSGSIEAGIKLINSYDEIWVTASSMNLRKEFKNYKYAKTSDNENELKPIDAHNHGVDGMRYAELNSKYAVTTLHFEINPADF